MNVHITRFHQLTRLGLLLLVLPLSQQNMKAQGTCATALTLNEGATSATTSATAIWYTFTATNTYVTLTLYDGDLVGSGFTTIKLYSGSCSSLNLLATSPAIVDAAIINRSTVNGTSYWLKIEKSVGTNKPYSISRVSMGNPPATCACNTFPSNPNNTCELICNGGFDNQLLASPPSTISPNAAAQVQLACPWNNIPSLAPSYSTSDLFSNNGAFGNYLTTNNIFGNQTPYNNSYGYAGIITYSTSTIDYREYLVAPLSGSLIAGQSYTLSFYISLSDKSRFASRNIGAWLTTSIPIQSATYSNLSVPNASLAAVITTYTTNTAGWTPVTATFTATAAQSNALYIVIGNFETDASQAPQTIIPAPTNGLNFTYYYIDEVSLRPTATVQITPTSSSPCIGNSISMTAAVSPAVPLRIGHGRAARRLLPTVKAPIAIRLLHHRPLSQLIQQQPHYQIMGAPYPTPLP